MNAYQGFHESYFAHSCPIISEKDVLYTDIHGTDYLAALKRWYHDLFLLWTNDDNSRHFYNSSHAMRMERFRQFRKYRSRIHPMSKFTNFWQNLILFAFILNKCLFRCTSTLIYHDIGVPFYYCGVCLEILIFIDLYVSLKTGYVHGPMKHVVLAFKDCLIHFCSKKLFLHVISLIPLHSLLFMKFGLGVNCGLCKCSLFVCVIKILSMFSLYRIFELSASWTRKRMAPKKMHLLRILRVFVLGIMTMLQFYDLIDVVWIMFLIYTETLSWTSFIGMLILMKHGLLNSIPNVITFCFDSSRVFKSLLRFSFAVKHSHCMLDKLASVLAYIIASMFYAWSLLECYALINRIFYPDDKLQCTQKYVHNLIKFRHFRNANEIKSKLDQYFEFHPTRFKVLELGNCLYKSVPKFIKDEAILSCRSKLLFRLPIFQDWPLPVVEEIVLLLKSEIYLPNTVVAESGCPGNGLMIVDVGILAVYSKEKETGHLIDGDYFGEVSLITDNETRVSYVVAVSTCMMLILNKFVFRKYMRQHPQLFYQLRTYLISSYKKAPKRKTSGDNAIIKN